MRFLKQYMIDSGVKLIYLQKKPNNENNKNQSDYSPRAMRNKIPADIYNKNTSLISQSSESKSQRSDSKSDSRSGSQLAQLDSDSESQPKNLSIYSANPPPRPPPRKDDYPFVRSIYLPNPNEAKQNEAKQPSNEPKPPPPTTKVHNRPVTPGRYRPGRYKGGKKTRKRRRIRPKSK